MSTSVEKRVVEMQFDNSKFKSGITQTINDLKNLDASLELKNGAKGIASVSTAAKNVSLNPIERAIDFVNSAFENMGVVGIAALAKITSAAMDAGSSLLKSLVDPLVQGGKTRALNIEQAGFQLKGLVKDSEEVQKFMDAAMDSVTDTSFGFDEAAKAAANFVATGMDVEGVKGALKGVAGVAAMGGKSFGEVANVFQKVAGQGRLMGDDLNRLASYGVNAAATLADQWGITEAEVRELTSQGVISFNDFAAAMGNAFGDQAKEANKTFTGALSNMKSALARIGEKFWTPVHESARLLMVDALIPLINTVNKIVTPAIDALTGGIGFLAQVAIKALQGVNAFLSIFTDTEGDAFTQLPAGIQFLATAFENLGKIVTSIKDTIGKAFNDVFPPMEISFESITDLLTGLAEKFKNWTESIMPSEDALGKLYDVCVSIFTFFRNIKDVVGNGLVIAFTALGKAVEFVKNIFIGAVTFVKEFANQLDATYNITGRVAGFMDRLAEKFRNFVGSIEFTLPPFGEFIDLNGIMAYAVNAATKAIDFLIGIFNKVSTALSPVVDAFKSGAAAVKEFLSELFNGENIVSSFTNVLDGLKNVVGKIKDFFKPLTDAVGGFINGVLGSFGQFDLITLFAVGAGAGGGALIYQIIGLLGELKNATKGFNRFKDAALEIAASFDNVIKTVQGTLESFTASIKAEALKTIAVAILILVGALWALTLIDQDKLGTGMLALTGLVGELVGALAILSKMNIGKLETGKLLAQMMSLSVTLILLAVALKIVGSIPIDQMVASLIVLGGLLFVMAGALAFLAKNTKGLGQVKMEAVVSGIRGIATALLILAVALKIVGSIPVLNLVTGMLALAAMLYAIVGAFVALQKAKVNPAEMAASATSIVAVAAGIAILAVALRILAGVNPDQLGQGIVALAITLGLLVLALKLLNGTAITGAAAILAIAAALGMLVPVLLLLGVVPMAVLSQGLGALGVTLLFFMLAVKAISKDGLQGAAAILALAFAMQMMVPVIFALGFAPAEAVAQGLFFLTLGLLAITGISSMLGTKAIPGLLALAGVLISFGVSLLLAGAGMTLFAGALTVFSTVGLPAVVALLLFAGAIALIIVFAPQILTAAIVFLALGVATLVLGAGMLVLGAACLVLASGLVVLSGSVTLGLAAIETLVIKIAELLEYAAPLALFGAALIVFGVGALLTGAGLIVMAVGLGLAAGALMLFSTVGEEAFQAMVKIGDAAILMFDAVGAFVVVGAALIIFGAGAIIGGLGAVVFGAGVFVLAGALGALALTLPMVSTSLLVFLQSLSQIAPYAGDLLAFSGAFLVFGVVAIIASLGCLLLGGALIVLSEGFKAIESAGTGGIDILWQLADASGHFAWNAPGLIAGAVGLLAFGIAAVVVGAASVLLAAGVGSLTESLDTLTNQSGDIEPVLSELVRGLEKLSPSIPTVIETAGPLIDLSNALSQLAPSAEQSAVALNMLFPAIDRVNSSASSFDVASINNMAGSLDTLSASADTTQVDNMSGSIDELEAVNTGGIDGMSGSLSNLTAMSDPTAVDGMAGSLEGMEGLDTSALNGMGGSLESLQGLDPSALEGMSGSLEGMEGLDTASLDGMGDMLGGMEGLDPSALEGMTGALTGASEVDPSNVESMGTSLEGMQDLDPTPVKEITGALKETQSLDATPIDNMQAALLALSEIDASNTTNISEALSVIGPATNTANTSIAFLNTSLSLFVNNVDKMIASTSRVTAVSTTFKNMETSVKASFVSISNSMSQLVANLSRSTLDIIRTFTNVGTSISVGLNASLPAVKMAGVNLVLGFLSGANSKVWDVYNKGKEIGQTAVDGINAGAGNRSPSKKTRLSGINADQGLINGLIYLASRVKSTGEMVGEGAAEGIREGFDDVELVPTIAPITEFGDTRELPTLSPNPKRLNEVRQIGETASEMNQPVTKYEVNISVDATNYDTSQELVNKLAPKIERVIMRGVSR